MDTFIICITLCCLFRNTVIGRQMLVSHNDGVIVTSSSQYGSDDRWDVYNVVDKSNRTDATSCRCCSATQKELNPWYKVDFGQEYSILRTHVLGRTDISAKTLYKMEIQLGSSESEGIVLQGINTNIKDIRELDHILTSPEIARFITLTMRGVDSIFVVCELYVYGECVDGRYGPTCTEDCGQCNSNEICDKRSGDCPTDCSAGYQGATCKEVCNWGIYGMNCASICGRCENNASCNNVDGACKSCVTGYLSPVCKDCIEGRYGSTCGEDCGHCINNDVCNKRDGNCLRCCSAGYKGNTCKEDCTKGTYGPNCVETCGQCQNNEPCDGVSGVCPECVNGHQSPLCRECVDGRYGPTCTEDCGQCYNNEVCDKSSGNCPNDCSAGYQGTTCKEVCNLGTYGMNCANICGRCENNASCNNVDGACTSCVTGYLSPACKDCIEGRYGSTCGEDCGHCINNDVCNKSDGNCPRGCSAGYKGNTCKEVCTEGTYGPDCVETCGKCKNNETCDGVFGACSECINGYQSPLCKDCIGGRYGSTCGEDCGHCINNDVCNKGNGKCPRDCSAGYKGNTCKEECKAGTHGFNCKQRCGMCRNADVCDIYTGQCPNGCMDEYKGSQCSQKINQDISLPVFIGSLSAVIVVYTVVNGLVWWFYRKKLNRTTHQAANSEYISIQLPTTSSNYDALRFNNPDRETTYEYM